MLDFIRDKGGGCFAVYEGTAALVGFVLGGACEGSTEAFAEEEAPILGISFCG